MTNRLEKTGSHLSAINGYRSALEQIVVKIRQEAEAQPCNVACKMQEIADDIDIHVFSKDIERAWTMEQWQAWVDEQMKQKRSSRD